MEIFFVVIVFSIVQSIFGVGLLLFGTPTLLLLGLDFEQALWTLLPSSIFISLYQIYEKYPLIIKTKKNIYFYTLPPLVVGVFFVVTNDRLIDVEKIVGMFLLLSGSVRLFRKFRFMFHRMIKEHVSLYCMFMGAIHGVSNMGGGPLTVLMSSQYIRKEMIQANIAYVYFLFGITQLIVLSIVGRYHVEFDSVLLIAISSIVFYISNKYILHLFNNQKYQRLITYLILLYGVVMISSEGLIELVGGRV